VRNRVKRDSSRPRLSVFRSHKHLYAQVIDDEAAKTLVVASTIEPSMRDQTAGISKTEAAKLIGTAVAQRALEAGVQKVAFDRREYKYHGRVAALADAARDAGLDLGAKKVIEEDEKPQAKKKGGKKGGGKGGKKEGGGKSKGKDQAAKGKKK
jgi:large subunit ribosomal protein L18